MSERTTQRQVWLTWLLRAGIALVALVVLLLVTVAVVLAIPSNRIWIAETALRIGLSAKHVDVGAAEGSWPSEIILKDVSVHDVEGPWLTADRITLQWHPWAQLRGKTDIDVLDAGTITILRPATGGDGSPPNVTALQRLFNSLTVRQLSIESLALNDPDTQRAMVLSIAASLRSDNLGRVLQVDVRRKDLPGQAMLKAEATPQRTTFLLQAGLANVRVDGRLVSETRANQLSGTLRVDCAGESEGEKACYTWPGGEIGSANVTAFVSGPLKQPIYKAEANARRLVLGERRVDVLTANAEMTRDDKGRDRITAKGDLTGIKQALPETAALTGDSGAWSAQVLRDGPAFIFEQVQLALGDANLQGSAKLAGNVLSDVVATFQAKGIGRIAGVDDTTSQTHGDLMFRRLAQDGADGHVEIMVTNMPPAMAVPPFAQGDLRLRTDITTVDQRLRLGNVALTWGGVKLDGQSNWSMKEGFVHDTTEFDVVLGGEGIAMLPKPLDARITAKGRLGDVAVAVNGAAPEFVLPSGPLRSFTLKADAKQNSGAWNGAVAAAGQRGETPVTLDVAFSQPTKSIFVLDSLRLAGNGVMLQGAARYDTTAKAIDGNFASNDQELMRLADLLGVKVTYGGYVRVALTPHQNKQDIRLTFDLPQFAGPSITADRLNGEVVLADAWGEGTLRAKVDGRDGVVVGRPLTSMTATATGKLSNMAVTVDAKGVAAAPMTLSTAANITSDGSTRRIEVQRLTLGNRQLNATLQQKARIALGPTETVLEPTKFAVGGGTIDAQLRVDKSKGTAAGNIKVTNVAANLSSGDINTFADVRVHADVAFSGAADNTTVEAKATTIYHSGDKRDGPITAQTTLTLKGGRAVVATKATGFSDEDMRLNAVVPARLDLADGQLIVDRDAPFTGDIAWRGDITPLWRLTAIDQHALSGRVDMDIRAKGTLAQPIVSGGLHLSKGQYENYISFTTLKDLSLDLTSRDGTTFDVALSATDGSGGKLGAKGHMTAAATRGWDVGLQADLQRFHVLRRDDITGAATGQIAYAGSLTTGTITGALQVVRAEMRLGASYLPEIPLLRAALETPQNTGAGFAGIVLDVKMGVADVVRVSGNGLESFWRGDLHAGGTVGRPDVVGTLTLARGTFAFLGQQFQLDNGTVTFTGGGAINPDLNLSASKQSTDITATVAITGNARRPEIALSSDPAVPQDEILARLLFRKDTSELGPIESLQLANAAADLSGIAAGGLNGILRKEFGLDTFGFGGRSGDSLVVGRQLTGNLYVGVEQSLTGSDREIVIERRLTPTLSLKSSTSSETGSDIGIIWRKNY